MRVLVVYATRAGSTRTIAEKIADVLRTRGIQADVHEASAAPSAEGYDAVILGSAIRMRRWLREAMGYLLRNCDQLQQTPVAYFTVSLTGVHRTALAESEARRYCEYPLHHFGDVAPAAYGCFNGVLDYSTLSITEGAYVRAFGVKQGDYRDWDEIERWALEAAEALGVLRPAHV